MLCLHFLADHTLAKQDTQSTQPTVLCMGRIPQNNMRACAIRSRAIATFINVSFELAMTICHVNGVKPGSSLGQVDCHSQPSDPAMYQRPSTAPSPVSHNTALCLFVSCFFPIICAFLPSLAAVDILL